MTKKELPTIKEFLKFASDHHARKSTVGVDLNADGMTIYAKDAGIPESSDILYEGEAEDLQGFMAGFLIAVAIIKEPKKEVEWKAK